VLGSQQNEDVLLTTSSMFMLGIWAETLLAVDSVFDNLAACHSNKCVITL
jgi:hypothetical protein